MESERHVKASGKTEKLIHNYQKNIRGHWVIENKLHWTLDVIFQEDADRKKNKNAA